MSPADPASSPPNIVALILAAGQGTRMGGPNKLLAAIDGRSLVRRAAAAALASRAQSVVVVTGHGRDAVERALSGVNVRLVDNPHYRDGLSTSLGTGVAVLPDDADGVVVMLADMPFVSAATLDRLIDAFDPAARRLIVVPTHDGRRGNPVLWHREFFPALQALSGDAGARGLIAIHADVVASIELGTEVAIDIDTPEAARDAGATLPGTDC